MDNCDGVDPRLMSVLKYCKDGAIDWFYLVKDGLFIFGVIGYFFFFAALVVLDFLFFLGASVSSTS